MKTFRYPRGHKDGETVTAGELIALLGKYPSDMPVLASWEGIYAFVHPDKDNKVETPRHWHHDDNEPCLVFDVDIGYFHTSQKAGR